MKPKYGYCAVTADFFHIGHLNFIKACAEQCQELIVGVMSDKCVQSYKGSKPIMNEIDRMRIVSSIRFVKECRLQDSYAFPDEIILMRSSFDDNFVILDSSEHMRKGADIIVERTPGISSSNFKVRNENTDLSKYPL